MARHIGRGFHARADGYLWNEAVAAADGQTAVIVPLYRAPEPLAGVEIPRGFRGILRVQEGAEPQIPGVPASWPAGQREFYTVVRPDGITKLEAPPKLGDGQS